MFVKSNRYFGGVLSITLLFLLFSSLMGCGHLRKKEWLPDHRQDYLREAKTVPSLVSPPGSAPIKRDDYYYVPPLTTSENNNAKLVPLVPPTRSLARLNHSNR